MEGAESETLLVLTTMPEREAALELARVLVEKRLAACVNILSGCTSVYRWEDNLERAEEVPLLIKTRAGRYAELEAAIRSLHPYELPEIIAVPIVQGFADYLGWVAEETAIAIG
jgi:periplasmic divalent cation tolerance protein